MAADAGTGAAGSAGGIVVEEAGLDRLDELMDWRMETLRAVFGAEGVGDAEVAEVEAANRAYYEQAIPAGEHIACLVRLDGEIVGCGGICLQREMPSPDNPSGKCAYLMNIYTRPSARHRGVGRATADWLVSRARDWGCDKIYLETSDAGRRLYERVGFRDLPGIMKLE